MMETFRQMLNECIRIGLSENKTSFMSLRYACYPELRKFKIPSAYKNNAISRASTILANYRRLIRKGNRTRRPYCAKPMITTCRGFGLKIINGNIVLPGKLSIPLKSYVLKKTLGSQIRSVTVNPEMLSICLSTEIMPVACVGIIGIDSNLENVTTATSSNDIKKFEMTDMVGAKLRYREIKRRFNRNDSRIRKRIFQKYGRLQVNKTQSDARARYKITSRIVKTARRHNLGIALEQLRNIRRLYLKGNGKGSNYRARLDAWAYGEFQNQIEYKAKRKGLIVFKVNARNTSIKCATCGDKMFLEEHRTLSCLNCAKRVDRDVNAAVNIMKRGLEKFFSTGFEPVGLSREVMKGNPMKKGTTEVIPGAEDSQVSQLNLLSHQNREKDFNRYQR